MSEKDRKPITAERLRRDIDRERTDGHPEHAGPAAAPLGTDAEAGGRPPSKEELELVQRGRKPGSKPPEDDDEA